LGIDRKAPEWIDGNAEEARIGVDKLILVSNHRIPQNTSIIEICQTYNRVSNLKRNGHDSW